VQAERHGAGVAAAQPEQQEAVPAQLPAAAWSAAGGRGPKRRKRPDPRLNDLTQLRGGVSRRWRSWAACSC